jgi:hypothetical protein
MYFYITYHIEIK